jgi:ribonuclease PH
MTGKGALVELQASAEGAAFSRAQFDEMYGLAEKGIAALVAAQSAAIG